VRVQFTAATSAAARQRGDTFSVPCWTRFEHIAATDAQLFSMSDEPLMRFSRFSRFEAD
jgi:gentisate 1,2-dioxygenase